MASMNKANQRQMGKSKSGKRHGFKKVRMHNIPMVCPVCGKKKDIPSAIVYQQGGNTCSTCRIESINASGQFLTTPVKMQMDVASKSFGSTLIKR